MNDNSARSGIKTFAALCGAQIISLFGSGLSRFGLGVWVFEETGSVTKFGLIALAASLPAIVLSPVAGALVDRWPRKTALLVSDGLAAASTVAVLLLVWAGRLELWHIYGAAFINSAASAFQWPAFSATTALLVPKAQLGRASGAVQMGQAFSLILSPIVAAALLVTIGLANLLIADLVTFVIAVVILVVLRIPDPERKPAKELPSFWSEVPVGWRYLRQRPGLLGLLALFAGVNLSTGTVQILFTPLILSFSGPTMLGRLQSIGAAGMLLGGMVMTAWGGPRQRMLGVFTGIAGAGLLLMMSGLRADPWLLGMALFGFLFLIPVINGCSQAIWQSKVEPAVQGRVFALRRMVATGSQPVAYLVGGPLADRLFEPLMAEGGALAPILGPLFGTGPGRGIGVMLTLVGAMILVSVTFGLASPRIRNLEAEVPDAIGEQPIAAAAG